MNRHFNFLSLHFKNYTDLANYKLYREQNKEAKKNNEEKPYNLTWIYENLTKTGHIIAN